MTAKSFDLPPLDAETVHQRIDELAGIPACAIGQMRITGRGEKTAVAKDFLDFEQIDAGFNQVGGIAVA
jgi:hypothetical protein